ncbi:MAG: DUF4430 domain-containing protein [Clostridia bacterium]|nr:DUF4430 domain-containing protein [Clostridia bacterium]
MKTKMTEVKQILSFILCAVLIATVALFTTGCNDDQPESPTDISSVADAAPGKRVLGNGQTVFDFTVVDKDGVATAFEIHTDETIVGKALQGVNLIAGDDGPYGLYVKTVNGISLDYDTDGLYWAFYENDAYAATGVDVTEIAPGVTYSFRASK